MDRNANMIFHLIITLQLLISSGLSEIDHCSLREDCSSCIQEPSCNWCSDPALNRTKSRCSQTKDLTCEDTFIVNPETTYSNTLDKPLLSYKSNSSEVVQITPQKIHLNARLNTATNITIKYARAENPVDLYYLMDLSYSMRDDKATLESLGKNIEESMRKFTSDFRLGFGSFIDKIVGPYVNTIPEKLNIPCANCTVPYGFHNHMTLSENVTNFPFEVGRAIVSGNIDDLEGGFDALMQAIVCNEEIGWRENARRLIVFSSDNGFHMAGDGKLGGIIEPNDGKCHMNGGFYTHSALQDYPSISHLNYKVRENSITIIFAVTEPLVEDYSNILKNIEGAKVGSLTADSSNILELLEEQYKKISSSVELQHTAPDSIQVSFYTSCQNEKSDLKLSNSCDELTIGQEVTFQVEIKVTNCSQNSKNWNQTFKIFPVGSQEATVVDITVACDCPCEHKEDKNYKENAPECSNNGTYMCGICSCNDMHFGHNCECSIDQSSDITLELVTTTDCKPKHDINAPICSNRGTCYCGKCQCDKRANENEVIEGKYCECDNFSCLRASGLLCSGHGTCNCGKCVCDYGWTHASKDDCNCALATDNCISSKNNKICNDQGDCKCNKCECNEEYEGEFCEEQISPSARTSQCEELLPCVLCLVHNSGPLDEEQCTQNCSSIIVEEVFQIEENSLGINCVQYDEKECRVEYQLIFNDTYLIVKALKHMDCPLRLSLSNTLFLITGIIIVGGIIALILWKIFTNWKDEREFLKFKKEKEKSIWDAGMNPLYKQPISTFQNPTYNNYLQEE